MSRRAVLVTGALLVMSGCSNRPATVTSVVPPLAATAESAVDALHRYLVDGDFAAAAALTITGQAALASLAEGATPAQVAEALGEGDSLVAANFWAGFAQGAGEAFLGDVTITSQGSLLEGTRTFYRVEVTPQGLTPQYLVTQDVDGHLVDLFASFGGGLAERMIPSVETIVGSTEPTDVLIMSDLRTVVDSLMVAATADNQSPDIVQATLRLVELITRTG